jgi:enterochelin esterase family protein
MRKTLSLYWALLSACLAGAPASAQQPAEPKAKAERPAVPAGRRAGFGPPVVSPEVHSDHRVTFRLRAPDAKQVSLAGEWPEGRKELTRDNAGVWSVTVGPLAADIYGYSFTIDGFQTLDPGNSALKPSRSPRTSILEIPGEPPRLHEFQDVPHGTVRLHEYRSRALGRHRRLHVYTPPDYDHDSQARYPVLYLLHGAGDDDATWTAFGRAHLILDNLIAQRKVRPMIVVMPDGHAAPFGPPPAAAARQPATQAPASGQPTAGKAARPPGPGGLGAGMARNVEAFERDLLGDIIPLVEAHYRAANAGASRAIAGLSMGGGQALAIGLNHPDRFASVGGFSSAVFNPEATFEPALKDPKATDSALEVIWIACGKDDFLIESNKRLDALLNENAIQHDFQITEGAHTWPVWRRYLAEFAPLLFVDKP